ncbi:hypothetical protein QJS10_CPA05g02287 [Acorus calamus]|uniref:Uncharacterized protein n=1 Tax=Acorus calamus TaxID=4465 RepID=A0AAV9EVU6_ACOCL|nr:hypothetical protein QJS10_CPA05g02287 [Acorus calamus]
MDQIPDPTKNWLRFPGEEPTLRPFSGSYFSLFILRALSFSGIEDRTVQKRVPGPGRRGSGSDRHRPRRGSRGPATTVVAEEVLRFGVLPEIGAETLYSDLVLAVDNRVIDLLEEDVTEVIVSDSDHASIEAEMNHDRQGSKFKKNLQIQRE